MKKQCQQNIDEIDVQVIQDANSSEWLVPNERDMYLPVRGGPKKGQLYRQSPMPIT